MRQNKPRLSMSSIGHSVVVVALGVMFGVSSSIRITRASTGILDESFGAGGKVLTRILYDSKLSAVTIQPDGKVVAAGYNRQTNGGPSDIAVVRYNVDGRLD